MQVPLDGTIVYGEAQVSMQHITGEAMPSRKGKGDAVPAGASLASPVRATAPQVPDACCSLHEWCRACPVTVWVLYLCRQPES